MDALRESVQYEHEKLERKRERERAEDENRRIRKLIALGIIQCDDSDAAIKNGYGNESIPKRREQRDRHKRDKPSIMEAEWYSDDLVTERSKPTEVTHRRKKEEEQEDGEKEDEDKEEGEGEEGKEEEEQHHPDPHIDRLYQEDSINGLYSTAAEVLRDSIQECGGQKDASGGGGGGDTQQQQQEQEQA